MIEANEEIIKKHEKILSGLVEIVLDSIKIYEENKSLLTKTAYEKYFSLMLLEVTKLCFLKASLSKKQDQVYYEKEILKELFDKNPILKKYKYINT